MADWEVPVPDYLPPSLFTEEGRRAAYEKLQREVLCAEGVDTVDCYAGLVALPEGCPERLKWYDVVGAALALFPWGSKLVWVIATWADRAYTAYTLARKATTASSAACKPKIRVGALYALGQLHAVRARDMVFGAMTQDPTPAVRAMAAWLFSHTLAEGGLITDDIAIEELSAIWTATAYLKKNDPHAEARKAAAEAYNFLYLILKRRQDELRAVNNARPSKYAWAFVAGVVAVATSSVAMVYWSKEN